MAEEARVDGERQEGAVEDNDIRKVRDTTASKEVSG